MNFVSRSARVHACNHRAVDLRFEEQGCAASCGSVTCGDRFALRLQHIAVDFQTAPGARLSLQINAALLGRISLLCYLLPAAMMLIGAGFAGWISDFSDDGSAIIGAAAGLALSGVLLRLYDSRHGFRLWQVEPDHQESGAGIG